LGAYYAIAFQVYIALEHLYGRFRITVKIFVCRLPQSIGKFFGGGGQSIL
jgi:hypothetical protein